MFLFWTKLSGEKSTNEVCLGYYNDQYDISNINIYDKIIYYASHCNVLIGINTQKQLSSLSQTDRWDADPYAIPRW